MRVVLASDHGGYELKELLKDYITELDHEWEDLGTYSAESVDYPAYGHAAGKAVVEGKAEAAIVICGTGLGISMAANKVPGIRAALCTTSTHARLAREHNNANVLALGGRLTGIELAKDIVETFLNTDFQGGRHERRVSKIEEI